MTNRGFSELLSKRCVNQERIPEALNRAECKEQNGMSLGGLFKLLNIHQRWKMGKDVF